MSKYVGSRASHMSAGCCAAQSATNIAWGKVRVATAGAPGTGAPVALYVSGPMMEAAYVAGGSGR
jgi:hypothetical protein